MDDDGWYTDEGWLTDYELIEREKDYEASLDWDD